MPTKKDKDPIPYVIQGSEHDQNVRFYERYDENFLFNKVATLLYVVVNGEEVVRQVEAHILEAGGGKLSERYLESLRAEVFFSTLHQCETFFALLIALFQPLPHWLYLTTYGTKEIKDVIQHIVDGQIAEVTGGAITDVSDFIKIAVYSEVMPKDPERAGTWDENLNNTAWLIRRIGEFFLKYDRAYNSYKHGLRVMTGPHRLSIGLQGWDGAVRGQMHTIQASEDALTYLQKEPVREVDGGREIPISEVTKAFNPTEAFFFMAKMQQMLETIKATRLAHLIGNEAGPTINTFFGLDKDQVRSLARLDEWTTKPLAADEARRYEQFVAYMKARAQAEQGSPTQAKESVDGSDSDAESPAPTPPPND